NLNDSGPGSLRQAIADANKGDHIGFEIEGTIPLASPLVVNKSIVIAGLAGITLSGQHAHGVLNVTSGADVSIYGIDFVDGTALAGDGGIIFNDGSLSLSLCNIQ